MPRKADVGETWIPLTLFGVSEYIVRSLREYGTMELAFDILLANLNSESVRTHPSYASLKREACEVLRRRQLTRSVR